MIQIVSWTLIGVIAGALLMWKFGKTASAFTEGEVLLITQKIEDVKQKDIQAYNALVTEWKDFIANKKAKLERVSGELGKIIEEVRS